jgi:chromosome partitioning protein
MRRIAVINQKGGVGKTTTCCNVGAALASAGKSVLLIDLDPQAHLTMHLGIEPGGDAPTIYEVLTNRTSVDEATIRCRENLWLVPSHIDLAAAEMELVGVMGREAILGDALRKLPRPYDYLIVDCPPSLGVLTVNGLAAVAEVFIPLQPHFLALQGVGKLLETISLVQTRINPALRVTGIVLCLYEAGTKLATEVTADVDRFLGSFRRTDKPWSRARIFRALIRRNIKLAECPSHGLTIFEYAPRSNGAIDYAELAAEVADDTRPGLAATAAETEAWAAPRKRSESKSSTQKQGEPISVQRTPAVQTGSRVVLGPDDVPATDVTATNQQGAAVLDQQPDSPEHAVPPVRSDG